MSEANIKNVILHLVDKEVDEAPEIKLRGEENVIDANATKLNRELSALFRRTGLNIGHFLPSPTEAESLPEFEKLLKLYYSDGQFSDFTSFTRSAAEWLKHVLSQSSANRAVGGYLLFVHYTVDNIHFLAVAILRNKGGLRVKDGLNLEDVETIDLEKLHIGARINLNGWIEEDKEAEERSGRYIHFKKGRAASITNYFTSYIGCEPFTRAQEQDTKTLKKVCEDYADAFEMKDEEKIEVLKHVMAQCKDWIKEDKPIFLDELSKQLDAKFQIAEEDYGAFLEFAQEDYNLSNQLSLHSPTLNRFLKFRGKNSDMLIEFKRSAKSEGKVVFDKTNNTLTFMEMPTELLNALIEEDNNSNSNG